MGGAVGRPAEMTSEPASTSKQPATAAVAASAFIPHLPVSRSCARDPSLNCGTCSLEALYHAAVHICLQPASACACARARTAPEPRLAARPRPRRRRPLRVTGLLAVTRRSAPTEGPDVGGDSLDLLIGQLGAAFGRHRYHGFFRLGDAGRNQLHDFTERAVVVQPFLIGK